MPPGGSSFDLLKKKKEKAKAAKLSSKPPPPAAKTYSPPPNAATTGEDDGAREIRRAERVLEEINSAMEAANWARLSAALDKAEKIQVTFRLLKAVPIGKAIKKVGKKAGDKTCAAKATAMVTRWKNMFSA